ncbi:stage III sporulation protein AG [Cohnella sp. CFH 77786]|uniref:stage III sporulation protein AG n=1 Tax=Cohnella sp. CFH 77786 TaxID=2662265 RepID=UPI001C610234|nr:stage III sporulation protein AG [Cohnella sp. CFH 77786]MBW5446779.1 stage III sporulation protein AG [Cohnella sp. CFH 77786]
MAKWLERLETFIGGGTGGGRRIKTFRWLVLLGLIGAALLLASSLLQVKPVDPRDQSEITPPGDQDAPLDQETFRGGGDKGDPFSEIESQLEGRLKDLLETMVGVGSVNVLVTVESTEETVVQQDEKKTQQLTNESDKNGTSRHITDITSEGQVVLYEVSGGQAPIVVKKLKPRVRGVVVVAKGAENATVRKIIQEAVSRGLDVPTHRISVVPRKT